MKNKIKDNLINHIIINNRGLLARYGKFNELLSLNKLLYKISTEHKNKYIYNDITIIVSSSLYNKIDLDRYNNIIYIYHTKKQHIEHLIIDALFFLHNNYVGEIIDGYSVNQLKNNILNILDNHKEYNSLTFDVNKFIDELYAIYPEYFDGKLSEDSFYKFNLTITEILNKMLKTYNGMIPAGLEQYIFYDYGC